MVCVRKPILTFNHIKSNRETEREKAKERKEKITREYKTSRLNI